MPFDKDEQFLFPFIAGGDARGVVLEHPEAEYSIPRRFASIAARYAERVAVATPNHQWTYRELDVFSDFLAAKMSEASGGDLARIDAGPAPVALLMDHDAPLIGAILATVKSGRPYVALDPADSPARRQAVYDASGATLLVVDRSARLKGRQLTNIRGRLIDAGDDPAAAIDHEASAASCAAELAAVSPDAPAEIAFTSGTTSAPKGVCRSHRAILHHCRNYTLMAQLRPADRLSHVTPCSLGASMSALWGALLNGAALLPFDLRAHGVAALRSWARQYRPTVLHCVPSVFRSLAAAARDCDRSPLETLRVLRLGGEQVRAADIDLFRRDTSPDCKLLVTYSLTETMAVSAATIGHHSPRTASADAPGLGSDALAMRILPGMSVQILDEAGQPVPDGTIGSIHVTSHYLSIGYWLDSRLSSERFKPDADDPRRQTFDTRDLGKIDANGLLVQCGRNDSILKIRGRRVDPAEVESALAALEGVQEAAVVGREHAGQLLLLAYVMCPESIYPGAASLRQRLGETLAAHQIPAQLIRLDEFPRTAGGKINRAALPAPQFAPTEIIPRSQAQRQASALEETDRSPPSEEEQALEAEIAAVWEEALGVSGIGRRDDFFATLGADSLQTVRVITALERGLGRRIPMSALLDHPNVETLSRHFRREILDRSSSPLRLVQRGTPGRRPLFFLHGDIYGAGLYCHGLAQRLGAEQPFYSLAPLGFESGPPPRTIEQMAAFFLPQLRAVQPHGPYLLGGFCNSGLVAYEMARRLASAGEEIGLLALVRTSRLPIRWPGLRRLIESSAALLGISEDRALDLFADLHTRLRRRRRFARLRPWSSSASPAHFARRLQSMLRPLGLRRPAHDAAPADAISDAPVLARFRSVSAAHRRAGLRYLPGPYSGSVLVFWPEHDNYLLRGDRSAGWKRYAPHVIPYALPGRHDTCITQHGDVLGKYLLSHISG